MGRNETSLFRGVWYLGFDASWAVCENGRGDVFTLSRCRNEQAIVFEVPYNPELLIETAASYCHVVECVDLWVRQLPGHRNRLKLQMTSSTIMAILMPLSRISNTFSLLFCNLNMLGRMHRSSVSLKIELLDGIKVESRHVEFLCGGQSSVLRFCSTRHETCPLPSPFLLSPLLSNIQCPNYSSLNNEATLSTSISSPACPPSAPNSMSKPEDVCSPSSRSSHSRSLQPESQTFTERPCSSKYRTVTESRLPTR